MNRSSGVLQTSPVQQMIAGNPNWWSINGGAAIRPPPSHHHHHHHHHQQLMISSPFFPPPPASPFFSQFSPSNSSSSSSNWHDHNNNNNQDHHLPADSWSQLLMGGLVGEEDKCVGGRGMESFHHQQTPSGSVVEVKQESSGGNGGSCYVQYGNHDQVQSPAASWSHHHHHMMPLVSSPNNKSSCITAATTFSSTNNMLDFSGSGGADVRHPPPTLDRSSNSECNSPASGGALKKARVQPSASQSTFKVRKEKLGDRITALHQLVSPFGKTDTASVLLEAIGYIRFLQSQIEALSMPYLSSTGSAAGTIRHQQSAVQGERNSMFPEDPGQLLNTSSSMKRKGGPDQECGEQERKKDLRSRGLCLVPVSCTLQVGSDNGADYWAPASLGPNAGFR